MSSAALVIGIVVAIFVVIAIAVIVKSLRSQRLKSRFGPEYNRAVQETGSKTRAEAKLEELAKRVQSFKINDLPPTARADFVAAWQKTQGRFADDPNSALTEADRLVQNIMTVRGYPVTDFEQLPPISPSTTPSLSNTTEPDTILLCDTSKARQVRKT